VPRFGPSRFWDGNGLVEPGSQPDGQRDRRPASVPAGPGGPGPDRPTRAGRRPARGKRRRPRLLRRLFAHRSVRVVLVVFVAFVGWVGFSAGQALTAPGNTNTSTRLAEWARDHYLGPVVTFGEWVTYQPPKVGGKPKFSLAAPSTPARAGRPYPTSKATAATITPDVPAQLSSPAGPPLPGEGQWRVLAGVGGIPAIYGTYLRPDSVHTSYVAGIASMDQRLLTFQLRPGAEDPGPGNWGYAPWLLPGSRTGVLATFNGGFKLDAAEGGFYLNGMTKGTLTQGAAALVYYKNGHVAIGEWGRGVGMSSQVLGVRQNLRLIVDHGAVPAAVDQNVQSQWGATLGGGYYVWRSGIGITSDGRIVFVYGPALSVRSLADLLQRAGVVEGMQLDINPAWMSYMYYKPSPSASDPAPVNLLPDQAEPANRYYSVNSRDFTAVYAR
jgi:Phosphodiester glycosidase